jgi:hypothetical protein
MLCDNNECALLYILAPGLYPLISDIVVFLAYVGSQVTQADLFT